MGQVIIRYIDLPYSIYGFVREDSEGDYNVYINARMSYDMQQKALRHELRHIYNCDFSNELAITEVEGIKI